MEANAVAGETGGSHGGGCGSTEGVIGVRASACDQLRRTILQISMEVFKTESAEIIRRFASGKISHAECLAALDAAVLGIVTPLKPEEVAQIRAIMLTNNEILAKEARRRQTRP